MFPLEQTAYSVVKSLIPWRPELRDLSEVTYPHSCGRVQRGSYSNDKSLIGLIEVI